MLAPFNGEWQQHDGFALLAVACIVAVAIVAVAIVAGILTAGY